MLAKHAIPRPLVNEPVGPYTVDGLYTHGRLVIELDSRGAHETTKAFEEDRRRDRDLLTKATGSSASPGASSTTAKRSSLAS